ncbi:hypothetical protein DFR52_104174 [Hoeflea marina]|uniref:Uncharacterized protein n=1 Tax=Hoeflea marina TaxID=274592 RepID=A0A317PLE8_9HYPH|nr:hypothetical protein DFR52_104174 [Hoeflea marina]
MNKRVYAKPALMKSSLTLQAVTAGAFVSGDK